MPSTKIHASERPIGEIFSDEFRFSVPRYQRPYAWTTEQAGEMYDDLVTAATVKADLDDADPYFLGSIVVVKRDGDADAEIVDGQQRLTTLTILLASLCARVEPDLAGDIEKRLFQKGDLIKKTVDQPRLRLRERDQAFFKARIQNRKGIATLGELSIDGLASDSQRNIVQNARLFLDRLEQLPLTDRLRLIEFVDQHTFLVLVATQDFESAYRIFTVLNERGLNLTHTDILKSEIIGQIPDSEQDLYTKKWENEEEDLGRESFADLFGHIRMVYGKTKARESILREFRASVVSKVPDGRKLIDDVLVPLSDAFETVSRSDYKAPSGAEQVNRLLSWLNLLDNQDWVPPAISYFADDTKGSDDHRAFLEELERLAASMLIRRTDVTRRIERYGRVLEAIETGTDLFAPGSPLQLEPNERSETVERLRGDIYTVTRIRLYVLLRLDSALSSGGASYEHPVITVEHVLPQNPATPSRWREWFTDEDRELWTHRLANLALLTRRKNAEANNYEFDVKKDRYFRTSSGVSPFALTTQVLKETHWTPALLSSRQEILVAKLVEVWRL